MEGQRWRIVLCAVCCVGGTRTADAAPAADAVMLEWAAPDECPSAADVSARTSARLAPGARVSARGRITNTAGRYKLVLEVASRGERVLEATTCEALASSASIVLAMSVASAPDDRVASTPMPTSTATIPAAAPSVERSKPEPERVPRREASFQRSTHLRLHAVGDTGMLPSFGAGGGLALGIDPVRALHLEVMGNYWASQRSTLDTDPTRGAAFQMVTASAHGCWVLMRPVVLAPCAGAEVMVLSASGFGANQTYDATSVAVGPVATLILGVPVGEHVMLRAGVGLTVPSTRQGFVIAAGPSIGANEVHRPAPVGARGWFGPEITF